MYVSGVKTQGKFIPRFRQQLWISAFKILYKMYPRQAAWLAVSDIGWEFKIIEGFWIIQVFFSLCIRGVKITEKVYELVIDCIALLKPLLLYQPDHKCSERELFFF